MRIVTVIGARPQFIKAATVSRVIDGLPGMEEILLHTGQHFDDNMSQVFFSELEIPKPKYNLGLGGRTHGSMTGRQLEAIEEVLLREKPDWTLVYGDTNSTLAGVLAAVKLHIPVAHVEAGLRSFNRAMPEEINRVLTDHAADLLFAPTKRAISNLEDEGIADRCYFVGDVMYDAALFYGEKAESCSSIIKTLGIKQGEYVLVTIHRAENTDDPSRIGEIVSAMCELGESREVVFPLHPRTKASLQANGILEKLSSNVLVINPVGYLDMVMLEKHASLVVTDSGGVQKEAFFQKVPCVTLRAETEWGELVSSGWNILATPSDKDAIMQVISDSIGTKGEPIAPYGNGKASERIVELLSQ